MQVGTRLSTFGNQAEDVGNVVIGIYQVVSELGGWFWAPCFLWRCPALLQEASGYEAGGLGLRMSSELPLVLQEPQTSLDLFRLHP